MNLIEQDLPGKIKLASLMQDIADMTSFIIAILSLGVPEEYEVD